MRLLGTALTALALSLPAAAHATAVFYVDNANPSCSDAGAGTLAQPYCTITGAMTAHKGAGVTILVRPGVYREQVTVPASGSASDSFVIRAQGAAIIDGSDSFATASLWTLVSGNVYLASSVTVLPKQVFVDGARLVASTAAPASMPSNTFQYVAGTGLYVNVGGGNPGSRQTLVTKRSYGFRIDKRSWVTIDGFTVTRTNDRGIYLTGPLTNDLVSSNAVQWNATNGIAAVTCSLSVFRSNTTSENSDHGFYLQTVNNSTIQDNVSFDNFRIGSLVANGIYLLTSNANLIQRNRVYHNQDSGLHFQTCANNVSVQNLAWGNGDHGIDHISTTGTQHVGDVAVSNFRNGFMVQTASTGTSLYDCIATNNGITSTNCNLSVDAASSSGLASNYNIFWNAGGQAPIRFGTTTYATAAAFSAVSGTDAQSLTADPMFSDTTGNFEPLSGSPAIDSGISSVANWPSADFRGRVRFDDPQAANTGAGSITYTDRGAFEFKRNLIPVARLTVSPSSGFPPLNVTADGSTSTDTDGSLAAYTFDFGDGTVVGPQPSATASHSYATGNWLLILTVKDDVGATDTMAVAISVAPNQVGNPSFEANTTGWNAYAGGTIARLAGGHDGSFGLQMTAPATGTASFGVNDSPNWVNNTTVGTRYRFTAWVRSDANVGTAKLQVREFSGAPAVLKGSIYSPGVHLSPSWQSVTVDYMTTTAASTLDFQVLDFPGVVGEVFWTDDVSIRAVGTDSPPVVTAPALVTVAENAPLTVAVTAADPDSEVLASLTADLSHLPAGNNAIFVAASNSRSGTLTWTPTFKDSGSYTVTFVAANGFAGNVTTTLRVTNVDRKPTTTAPATVNGTENAPLTVAVTAADPDSDAIASLTAVLTGLPLGHNAVFTAAADKKSGTLTWTPTFKDSGSWTVRFRTTANGLTDSATTVLKVANLDRAPIVSVAPNPTGNEGAPFSLAVSVSDPDSDVVVSLIPNLAGLPAGHNAVFTQNPNHRNGTLTWTPTYQDSGAWTVGFTASNALTGTASSSIRIANGDRVPVVTAAAIASALENAPFSMNVTVADPDSEAITSLIANLSALPAGNNAVFTAAANKRSATLTWTPSYLDSGAYNVTFTATNAGTGQAVTSIRVANADRAPIVSSPALNQVNEGAPISMNVSVADPDSDPIGTLTANLAGLPAGHNAVFTPGAGNVSGVFTWTPTAADSGTYSVTFTASNGLTAASTSAIHVNNLDRAPVVTAPPTATAAENAALTVSVTAADPDNDPIVSLSANLLGLPAGNAAVFTPAADKKSGVLSWTPGFADSGVFSVTFTASNALSGASVTSVRITNVDRAPVVTAPVIVPIVENTPVTIDVTVADPDNDAITTLTANLAALPAGHNAVFTPAADKKSGHLTWTHKPGDGPGPFAIPFTATNALLATASSSIKVDRYPVLGAPTSVSGQEASVITINVTVSDLDGDAVDSLAVDVSSLPAGNNAAFTTNPTHTAGTFTWTPSYNDAPGPYAVRFRAGNALAVNATTSVSVVNKDRAPVIVAPSIKNTSENLAVQVDVTAGDLDGDGIATLAADLSHLPSGHGAIFTVAPDHATGTLSWTPTYADSGAFDVTFSGTNALSGNTTSRILVANVDRAPIVSAPANAAAREDSTVTIAVTALDPDGDAITSFSPNLSVLPAGNGAVWTPAADKKSGTLSWKPGFNDAPGPYAIVFTAANAMSGTGSTSVAVQNVDRAPSITAPLTASVLEEQPISLQIVVADPDGEAITSLIADLSALPASKNPTFVPAADNKSGTLSWTPSYQDQGGPYTVTFTALNVLQSTAVTAINVSNVDRSPIVSAPVSVTVDENSVATVNVTASDLDGDAITALTADLSGLPAGHNAVFSAAGDGRSGTLTWTPTFADARPAAYDVVFTAHNAFTGSASTPITVHNVDRAPVVTAPATASVAENALLSVGVTVADPDGDSITALTADLSHFPAGSNAAFTPAADKKSGTLTWTPAFDDAPGPYAVTFTASNALSASANSAVSVTNLDRAPVVTAAATARTPENAPFTLAITAADADGDAITALTADLSELPAGNNAVFTPAADKKSGTLTWTPTGSDGGTPYTVHVTAANALSSTSNTVITVDRHPVISAPVVVSGQETSTITVVVNVTDPDGDALTALSVDLSLLPPGHNAVFTVSPDKRTGTLTWTPGFADAGTYKIAFNASSGLSSTSETDIGVIDRDRAPVVAVPTTVKIAEGGALALDVTVVDPDGDPVTDLAVDLVNLPGGHNAVLTTAGNHLSGHFTWTPTMSDGRVGPYLITFTAQNGLSGSATTSIQVDQAPEVSAPVSVTVAENAPVTINATAVDPDGEAITSFGPDLSVLPAGHNATWTVNASKTAGTLTWTPSYASAPGPYAIVFTASNALSGASTSSVAVTNVDRMPVVVGPATAKTPQGTPLTVQVTASDPDGEAISSLTADFSSLPAGNNAVFTPAVDHLSGTLTWTPAANEAGGPFNVVFSATNAITGTLTSVVTVNQHPVITVPATATVVETSTVIVNVTAVDPDGEAIGSLTADLSSLPAGNNATFTTNANKTAGTLIWTPTYNDAPGPYPITFTATNTLTTLGSTSISVTQRDRNPVVTAPATVAGEQNAALTVNVTVSDPDGDAITSLVADLSGLPGGQFTPAADKKSGTLSWTPTMQDPRGPYTVTFTAANALSGTANSVITIQQYPVVTAPASQSVNENVTLTINVTAADADGDAITSLTADLTGLPAGHNATFVPNANKTAGTFTWTPGYFDAPGPYTVRFTASNSLSRNSTTTITVNNVDRAPVVVAPTTAKVAEGAPLTLNVTASDADNEAITMLSADLSALPAGHNAVFTVAADKKSGILTWTPTMSDGRVANYNLSFTAQNALQSSVPTSVKVDQAPEVTAPGSATVQESFPVTINVTVADPDNDALNSLVVDLSGLPAGNNASFSVAADKKSGTLTWTPTYDDSRVNPYVVTFTGANSLSGSSSTPITVTNRDRAPVMTVPATAKIGQGLPLTVNLTVSDPDNESIATLTADLSSLPSGNNAVFTPAADKKSGTLTWTPGAGDGRAAPYNVSFTAGNALAATGALAITVDRPPVVSSPAALAANENDQLTVTVTVTDADGDAITALTADLSALPVSSGAVFTPAADKKSGSLTWRPSYNDGPHAFNVTFTATNTMTGASSTAINVANLDRPPVVTAAATASSTENLAFTLIVTASDPDGEPITSLSANFAGMPAGHNAVFTPGAGNTSGVLSWTPGWFDAPGPYPVVFTAGNATSGSASTSITVANVDRSPVVTAPSTSAASQGVALSIPVTVADLDNDAIASLTADLTGLPAGNNAVFTAAADKKSGTLTWTPGAGVSAGPFAVVFRGANALIATATTSITVDRRPVMTAAATANVAELSSITLQVTASDPDNDAIGTLTADLSQLPAGHNAVFTPAADKKSGSLTWTPAGNDGRVNPYVVTYTAGNALSASVSTAIMVENRPVVTAPASLTIGEGTPVSFTVTATDADGQSINSLVANLSALPAGNNATFVVNASKTSATFTWTPTYVDSRTAAYFLTFTAANTLSGAAITSIKVTNTDRAPVVVAPAAVSGPESGLVTVTVSASDPDAQTITSLSANLSGLPAGHNAVFTPNASNTGGTLTWTPTAANGGQVFPVTFTAANALSGAGLTSITVDRYPVLTVPAATNASEGTPVSINMTVVDPDGQALTGLTADLSGLPSGHNAVFTAAADKKSGLLTWTPSYDDSRAQPYVVTFTAQNALTRSAQASITVANADRAPVVSAPATFNGSETLPLSLTINVADPDGQAITTLTADLTHLPASNNAVFTVAANKASGTLTWTPTYSDSGRYDVIVTATNALTGTGTTKVVIANTDRAPIVVAPATASGTENSPLAVHVSASDPDGDAINTLSAGLGVLPAGHNAVFTPDAGNLGGTLTWTPGYDASRATPYNLVFSAGNAMTGTGATAVTIGNIDRPTTVTSPASLTVAEGAVVTFNVAAVDPDGDAVTSLTGDFTNLPLINDANLSPNANNTSGVFIWTPGFDEAGGPYTVGFLANGARSNTAITVTDFDRAPVVTVPSSLTVAEGAALSVTVSASDPEGTAITTLSASLSNLPAGSNAAFAVKPDKTGGVFTWKPTFNDAPGLYLVTFTASNAKSATATLAITVTQANQPPVTRVTASPTTEIAPVEVTFDASASSDTDGSIASYFFVFGDGITTGPQASPITTHIYAAGNFLASVVSEDNAGARDTAGVFISPYQNLCTNGHFENDILGWTAVSDSLITKTSGGHNGFFSMKAIQAVNSASAFGFDDSPNFVATTAGVGTIYHFECWVRASSYHGQARIQVREMAGTTVRATVNSTSVTLETAWQKLSVDYPVAFAGTTLDLKILNTPVIKGEIFLVDDVLIRVINARKPVLTVPATATVNENGTLALNVTASDPDGEPIGVLSANLASLPVGSNATFVAASNKASGTLSWTPTFDDSRATPYAVSFLAANSESTTATSAITVVNVDRVPVVTAAGTVTSGEGAPITMNVTVSDPDGQSITSLTANLAGLPSGHNATFTAAANKASGVFHWTPTFDDSGSYTVTFTATNTATGTATTALRITQVDRVPTVTVPSSLFALENAMLTVHVTAADFDGQPINSLTADLSKLPAGHNAAFVVEPGNTGGTLSWMPVSANPKGPYLVTFTAQNQLTAAATCSLIVDHNPVMTAPSALAAFEMTPVIVNLTMSDSDNDAITALTADLSGLPAVNNATFTPDSTKRNGAFRWTPTFRDAGGPYVVTFTGGNRLTVVRTMQITVADVDAPPVVTAPVTVNATENQPLTIQITAFEPDGQAISSIGADFSGLPAGHNAVFTADPGATSGTMTWTPNFNAAPGPYTVTFHATNALTGTTTTTINVANVDRAPAIAALVDPFAIEGQTASFTINATDPDGQPINSLTADLSGLPPGNDATFTVGPMNTSATLTWTPTFVDATGPYLVVVTVRNALTSSSSLSVRVNNTDRPPVVTAPIVAGGREGVPMTVDVTASDPDGAAIFVLSADLAELPATSDATFAPAADNKSGRLTWTPAAGDSARGPFHVNFSAVNAAIGSASSTILVGSQDFAPVISSPASVTVNENGLLSMQVQAGDPNGEAITSLTANLSGLPSGNNAAFTSNATKTVGTLTWRPTYSDSKPVPYNVTFTASNNRSAATTSQITVANVDRAPVVTAPATAVGPDGSPISVTVVATDPDLQAITTFTADLSQLPAGNNATFTAPGNGSGTFSWTPQPADVRVQPYTVGFLGSNTLSGSATILITVNPRDRAPVVTAPSTLAVNENAPVTINITASDADGHAISGLTANLTGLPAGHNAVFTPNASKTAGTLTWTPTFNDGRVTPFNVTFTASNSLVGTATTAITVNNVDRAPAITAAATLTVVEATTVTSTVTAGDADGQAITGFTADLSAFPATNLPTFNVNASKSSGTLTWTPRNVDVRGTPYNVVFTATNTMTTTATTAITAAADNLAPNAVLTATPDGFSGSAVVTLSAAGSTDVDGTIASYTFDFGDGQTLGPQAGSTATHTYTAGAWTANVIVVDNKGGSATATVFVNGNLTNLVANPGYETNTTGWITSGSVTLTRVTTSPRTGTACLQLKGSSSASAVFGTSSSPNSVTSVAGVGRKYRFGAWARSATFTGKVALEVREFTGTTTQRGVTTKSNIVTLSPTWQYMTVDYVVTTAGTNLNLRALDTPNSASQIWFLDDVSIVLVPLGDQAPVVTAPAAATVVRNHPVTVNVTVSDPDGNAITSLVANLAGLPAGNNAVFTAAADKKSGTLTWTPTAADIRATPYNVVVTASNALSGTASTAITVIDSATTTNLVTNPGFETDLTGWAAYSTATISRVAGGHSGGFAIKSVGTSTGSFGIDDLPNIIATAALGDQFHFSCWVRSDNSAHVVKIRIYEFQGTTQVGATIYSPDVSLTTSWQQLQVNYTVTRANSNISVRITDYPTAANETFLVDDVEITKIGPAMTVAANDDAHLTDAAQAPRMSQPRAFAEAVRLDSEETTWAVRIEGVDGPDFEGSVPVIALHVGDKTLVADVAGIRMGDDVDGNGFEEIAATFPMETLRELLSSATEGHAEVTLEVGTGTTHARMVSMTASIQVPVLRFAAAFGPNPMSAQGTLFFSITKPGAVLAEVFDANGRRVRTLMNEASAKPGRFAVKLDGRGDHGERLAAGMYFYRLQSADGRLGGRFVIVR